MVSGTTLTVTGSSGTTKYQVAGALSGNHFAVQSDTHTIKLVAGAVASAYASFIASAAAPADSVAAAVTAAWQPAPVTIAAAPPRPELATAGSGLWALPTLLAHPLLFLPH